VLLSDGSLWHHRDEFGIVHCKKTHGAYLSVHQWSKEPRGRNDVCTYCRKHVDDAEREARRALREAAKGKPTLVISADKEPEILQLPPEEPPQQEETDMTAKAGVNGRLTVGEAAKLLDRPYGTIYSWVTRESKNLGLDYNRDTGTVAHKDLATLEKLASERLTRNRIKASDKNGHAAPKQPEVKKTTEPLTTAKVEVKLAPDQLLLASLMGKTEAEFIEWCVQEAVASIKQRLKLT